ncbi:MAG: hypothetical protein J6T28_10390 [Paludibacteraceae bacterium]|nr:hypothetical protein [Paludibacteraceae bacterium]MBP5481110.1 hypothetical protein [Paludibacteraceae bacterium]
MKKSFLIALLSMLVSFVCAQDIYVYSVIGKAEKQANGKWVALQKRDPLQLTDMIRVDNNSALSFIDRKAEKIYSISQNNGQKVSELIANYKSKQSYASNFVSHASKSLFNGGSDRISHEAAGCTYRGDIIENDIAKAILAKHNGSPLGSMNNAKTDYAISFSILDRRTKAELEGVVALDSQAVFRIKNSSDTPLYVNILDINKNGEKYDCLPIDDATTMSHLLIPGNCTIDLTTYPVEFSEPVGIDNLILIATEVPYDLRQVMKYFDKADASKVQSSNYPVGVYCKKIEVKQ